MKRRQLFVVGGALAALLLGGLLLLVTGHLSPVTHRSSQRTVYYCPMHPGIVKDRPGECPICYMKLVRQEPQTSEDRKQKAEGREQMKTARDICYLHNCPKIHEGRPCPMLVLAKEGEQVICPVCGTHVAEAATPPVKKILYWTDPMIPGYRSDKPGKSPMGMEMVPVYEEAAGPISPEIASPAGYAPILVTPQKQQLIGVRTAVVTRKPLTKTIRTVGTIARDPELYQAQAEYLQALQGVERAAQSTSPAIVEQAQRLVESAQIHLKHLGLSDELIREIATWKEADRSVLFTLPGDRVWVYAKVYEYELPLIRVGGDLLLDLAALPGHAFHGAVRAIDTIVDPTTRTTRIRAQVDDPQGQLKPEMYVNVTIAADLGEALAIPEEAVFHTGTRQIVFVAKGDGLFEPRDVTVGVKADGSYEVKAGVADGERVVTSGNFLIDSESRLKAALEGFAQPPPQAGGEHQHGQ